MNQPQLIIMETNTADNIARNGISALIGHSCWALIGKWEFQSSHPVLLTVTCVTKKWRKYKNLTENSKRFYFINRTWLKNLWEPLKHVIFYFLHSTRNVENNTNYTILILYYVYIIYILYHTTFNKYWIAIQQG